LRLRVVKNVLEARRPLDVQSLGPGPTTQSVAESIPTQSVGTRIRGLDLREPAQQKIPTTSMRFQTR
jgi:hypothetical protein